MIFIVLSILWTLSYRLLYYFLSEINVPILPYFHPYRIMLIILTVYSVLMVIALIQSPLGLLASYSVNVFSLNNMLMTVFSENYFF